MRIKVTFYAKSFHDIELQVEDGFHETFPKCDCGLYKSTKYKHFCERGKLVEDYIKKVSGFKDLSIISAKILK